MPEFKQVYLNWAETGNTDPIPSTKLTNVAGTISATTLATGSGAGLSLTNLNSFRSSGLQLLSPTFDMDNREGIVEFEANLTINTPSATNLKFVSGSGELTHTLQGWRTIEDLLAISVFHATNVSGVKLDEVDLYLGSINAGSVELWLERNANNELGYSLQYTNNNSATGSCSIASTIRGLFLPSGASTTQPGTQLSSAQLAAISRVPDQTTLNRIPTASEKNSFPRIPTSSSATSNRQNTRCHYYCQNTNNTSSGGY